MTRSTKSPIKRNPLRQAGESIREQQLDLVFDKLLTPYMIVGFVWTLVIFEWIQYINGTRLHPVLLTVFAGLLTLYAGARMFSAYRSLQNLNKGYTGERVVGEFLDRLRANGYRVYHDIPGDGGNIDHVIISNRGIYSIETKTRSKPERGKCRIEYNGSAVSVNGGPFDESPIIQARAQAKQLKRLLKEETGHDYPVRAVVLFPGWYIVQAEVGGNSSVWVLEPKAIHKWIEAQRELVSVTEVKLAATKLAAFVRKFK